MRAALKLECIGDDVLQSNRPWRGTVIDLKPRRPWCAELVDYDPGKDRFERSFLHGQRDYSQANSKGSRGVYKYYWLESGRVYEVYELRSWSKSRRYFAWVSNQGDIVEIKREHAILCLSAKNPSGSTS